MKDSEAIKEFSHLSRGPFTEYELLTMIDLEFQQIKRSYSGKLSALRRREPPSDTALRTLAFKNIVQYYEDGNLMRIPLNWKNLSRIVAYNKMSVQKLWAIFLRKYHIDQCR
jgi:hypothetical protein